MQKEVIRSRQNDKVKLVCSLEKKKAREESGLFRADGIKLFYEAVTKGLAIELCVVRESSLESLRKTLERDGIFFPEDKTVVVTDDVFEKISEEKSPEGIITVAKYLDKLHKIATINNKGEFFDLPAMSEKVMLLESIRDPGNLGTVIRSAASLGIDRLVLSRDCADIYNPKTIRAAMGSLFIQRIDILPDGEMPSYILSLRKTGRRVFAAALANDAQSLCDIELVAGDCFVIGNEGHGLGAQTIDACDASVIIPMSEGCESLNASAAATIFIWETSRI